MKNPVRKISLVTILRRVQSAINQCRNSTSCLRLLRENNVNLLDLDVASEFLEIPFDLPDVSLLMSDIQVLAKKGLVLLLLHIFGCSSTCDVSEI